MRICIDFDDVIMDYTTGEEIPGAGDWIRKKKQEGHRIIILTSNWLTHRGLLVGWLQSHNIPYDDLQLNKPMYEIYIDDRARRFEGWDKEYI